MDDILTEFIAESLEGLAGYDERLLALEGHSAADLPDVVAGIFRTMHTIKGTSGFLGFGHLEKVAHAAEEVLSALRDGELAASRTVVDALLEAGDTVRGLLRTVEATQADGDDDHADLIARLLAISTTDAAAAPAADAVGTPLDEGGDAALPGPAAEPRPQPTGDATVRVDVGLLDRLMNLVGELVLSRNQVLQVAADGSHELANPAQQLNHITTELQEGVMKTRMQPIGGVWRPLPRVVRDLAAAAGKQARLEVEGADTELDRSIIETIKDPLTHLVRNAVDHGLELPADRVAAGKPAEGVVHLRAFHEGGQVHIEVGDDGRGIDVGALRARAVERGVLGADRARAITDREALNLIFAPGFSTAATVTNVSGRGVGMDVVRSNVESIGGVVEVASRPGRGTTVRLTIPLTLAIIPALVVTTCGQRFAIPQINLLEVVRLDGDDGIEWLHDVPVHRLRGDLLPLVVLGEQLGRGRPAPGRAVNIVVLQVESQLFGLVVDQINDPEEIVVKPLDGHVQQIPVFAGATTMGDGEIALILDVRGLAESAHVLGAELADQPAAHQPTVSHDTGDVETLLLVAPVADRRVALPLSQIDRLERLPLADLEQVDGGVVVQHRGEIVAVLDLAALLGLGAAPHPPTGTLEAVVLSHAGQTVAVAVGEIVDIVETRLEASGAPTAALVGRAVVGDRVADIADLHRLVDQHLPVAAA